MSFPIQRSKSFMDFKRLFCFVFLHVAHMNVYRWLFFCNCNEYLVLSAGSTPQHRNTEDFITPIFSVWGPAKTHSGKCLHRRNHQPEACRRVFCLQVWNCCQSHTPKFYHWTKQLLPTSAASLMSTSLITRWASRSLLKDRSGWTHT